MTKAARLTIPKDKVKSSCKVDQSAVRELLAAKKGGYTVDSDDDDEDILGDALGDGSTSSISGGLNGMKKLMELENLKAKKRKSSQSSGSGEFGQLLKSMKKTLTAAKTTKTNTTNKQSSSFPSSSQAPQNVQQPKTKWVRMPSQNKGGDGNLIEINVFDDDGEEGEIEDYSYNGESRGESNKGLQEADCGYLSLPKKSMGKRSRGYAGGESTSTVAADFNPFVRRRTNPVNMWAVGKELRKNASDNVTSSSSSSSGNAWKDIERQSSNPNNLKCKICSSTNCGEDDLGRSGAKGDSGKIETWGRKDDGGELETRMRCLDCGAIWNTGE